MELDLEYWKTRWNDGKTGWIEAEANASLQAHVALFAEADTVLVPLCGSTSDMPFLAQRSQRVIGIDGVVQAAKTYFGERAEQGEPIAETLFGAEAWSKDNLSLVICDIFAVPKPEPIATAVYDRGALMALHPNDRTCYVKAVQALCVASPTWLLVLFEHDLPGTDPGPPFSLVESDLRALFPTQQITKLGERDLRDSMTRMAERGATYLREVSWRVR